MAHNPEQDRLTEHEAGNANWKRWGPYLSERAWGTVREDYSADGGRSKLARGHRHRSRRVRLERGTGCPAPRGGA